MGRMGKILPWLFAVLIIAVLLEAVYLLVFGPKKLDTRLPRIADTTNQSSTSASPYTRTGLVITPVEERLLIFPLPYGTPFYAAPDKIGLYPAPQYEVRVIKANPKAVAYGLGIFAGWEKAQLGKSKDRLILLADPLDRDRRFSFRVAFEDSALFGDNLTQLAIEDASTGYSQSLHLSVKDASAQALAKLLKQGATVIATPVQTGSEVNKKDEYGNLLAGWLIIRQ